MRRKTENNPCPALFLAKDARETRKLLAGGQTPISVRIWDEPHCVLPVHPGGQKRNILILDEIDRQYE